MLPFDGWLFNRLTIYNLGINNIVVIAQGYTITATNRLHSVALPIVGKRSINSHKCRYIVPLSNATHSGAQHICNVSSILLLLSFLQLCCKCNEHADRCCCCCPQQHRSAAGLKIAINLNIIPFKSSLANFWGAASLPLHSASQKRLN